MYGFNQTELEHALMEFVKRVASGDVQNPNESRVLRQSLICLPIFTSLILASIPLGYADVLMNTANRSTQMAEPNALSSAYVHHAAVISIMKRATP